MPSTWAGKLRILEISILTQPINSIPIEILIRLCVCVYTPIMHPRVKPWVSFFESRPPSFLKGFFLARNLASGPGCLVRKPQGYACLHLYHIWVSGAVDQTQVLMLA